MGQESLKGNGNSLPRLNHAGVVIIFTQGKARDRNTDTQLLKLQGWKDKVWGANWRLKWDCEWIQWKESLAPLSPKIRERVCGT